MHCLAVENIAFLLVVVYDTDDTILPYAIFIYCLNPLAFETTVGVEITPNNLNTKWDGDKGVLTESKDGYTA
jgi:hypothetical protein